MKNMTPVILVLLMLTSFFAGMDIHELEEQVVIEETGARAGADASVVAITTPKETSCGIQGCRNTLQVGEEVSFSAYIKNIGDADITDLTYSVKIYLSDSSQSVGGIAKDALGNDLIWENDNAMCDDGTLCDFDSSVSALAAGGFLGGGKLTLQRSGADILWTPTAGEYMIAIDVDADGDTDTSNDAELVYVVVEDWFDISVDLVWLVDDGTGTNTLMESDSDFFNAANVDVASFKLKVLADGSNTFNPREVNIRLETTGQVESASLGTTDISEITYITVGTASTVDVYSNESDPNATTQGTRNILSYQTAWEMSGQIEPADLATARFELTAEVANYTLYGQFEDCVESAEATEDGEDPETWANSCEVLESSDDRPKTDFDELTGSKVTYDDIRISRMGIYQGYNSDCSGLPSTFIQAGEEGDLNVGCSLIYADVEHRGSDLSKKYGWDVSYTISLDGTEVASGMMNECTVGLEVPYQYTPLGDSSPNGAACVQETLVPGQYTVEMTLTMDDKPGTNPDHSGGTDQRTSNNQMTMVANIVNNLPTITSFELTTEGDIVVGQESPLIFVVSAFDVDDPSGAGLSFSYNYPGGEIAGCSGTLAEGKSVCQSVVSPEFIGNSPVTVTVTDSHTGQVSEEIDMFVWNSAVATATSDAGIEVQYTVSYNGQSQFTIATLDDLETTSYESVQLEGFTGSYNAVAALEYAPSTTYTSSDVLDQTISLMASKDLEATSLWYIDSSGKWILLSDAATDFDATTDLFTYEVPGNSPVVPAGQMILMGGELAQASIPDASVSGFSAEATRGGAIAMTWDITGTLLNSDNIVVSICAVDADCEDAFEATVADVDRTYTYSGSQTTHGVTYHLEVAVCNEQGCSTPGISSVVADKQVDGDVSASNLAVGAENGQWVVSWEVTGDASDVAMWHVCWSTEDFTIGEMPTPCPDAAMGGDATTVSIDMPSIRNGQEYFFTAVPMDALGNMDAAASMNSIIDTRVTDTTNTDDGSGTIGDTGDDASSSVPTWTWGLIGGVVVVAFIAGAFILSRGDGEGGEGKDWDY